MKHVNTLALAACLGFALLQPAFAQSAADADAVATATAVLDRLDAGEFEAATADFNAQMKAALDAGQLKAAQQQLDTAGPVLSRGEPQVLQQDGMDVVVFRVERRDVVLDAVVTVDGDGKVAGLHFVPAAAGTTE